MAQQARGQNFTPYGNYAISATTSSTNQAVTQPSSGTGARDLYIYNPNAGIAFVAYGTTSQTANTTTSFAVPPGAAMIIDMDVFATNVAVIMSTGSGTVYISVGTGT